MVGLVPPLRLRSTVASRAPKHTTTKERKGSMNTKALKKDHVKERAPPWSIKLAKEGGRQDPFGKPITRVKGQRTQPAKAQTHADNQVLLCR